mgnify:CR=1 FL=1
MTYTEAYAHIDNLLDKAGTAYFIDEEKNQFLDLAVLEYTKGLINTLESDAQSMEKIAPLIVNSDPLVQASGIITLPTSIPAYHILRAYTISGYSINIMGYGEYASAKDNPFHKADTKNPIGLLRGAYMDVKGSIENIHVEYIKVPEVTHVAGENLGGYGVNSGEEIVNIAVRKMMLSLEDPRYQLQINELTAEKR